MPADITSPQPWGHFIRTQNTMTIVSQDTIVIMVTLKLLWKGVEDLDIVDELNTNSISEYIGIRANQAAQLQTRIVSIVCQMLSWSTKNSPHSIDIWDIEKKVVPMCSSLKAPSYDPQLTLLASVTTELPYLSMLFILELVQCRLAQNKYHDLIRQLVQKSSKWSALRLVWWRLECWTHCMTFDRL